MDQYLTYNDLIDKTNAVFAENQKILNRIHKMVGHKPFMVVESKDEREAGTRFELRRRYWAYALEFIKAAHGSEGAFRNVKTSKEYWINGSMGISGFYITCTAKMKLAAVELTLGKADRAANKSAFDYLFARKDEIEKSLGVQVDWWRFDGKSSYVSYHTDAIGIRDETNWTQMAKFHAEWSKKFYDVFVPLLQQWNAMR